MVGGRVVPLGGGRTWCLAKGEEVDWFNAEVERRVGNGASTRFWKVAWRREVAFMVKYPRLFSITNRQKAMVHEMWTSNETQGRWDFCWRRELLCGRITLLRSYWPTWRVLCGA